MTVDDILHELAEDKTARGGRSRRTRTELISGQLEISDRCAAQPEIDRRTADEILGHNGLGVFD